MAIRQNVFRHKIEDEVKVILSKQGVWTWHNPNFDFKKLDAVAVIITNIINVSLDQSEVPLVFQEELERPLLKKIRFDKEVYTSILRINAPF